VNSNAVSLVCRYDPNVGGMSSILQTGHITSTLEVLGDGKYRYNRVANGGSLEIKQGKGVNEFSVVCQGDQLSLYVNGKKVTTAVDAKYSFGEGQVGIGVASTDVLPVTVTMDFFKVSEP
jgi:hypothetical protein